MEPDLDGTPLCLRCLAPADPLEHYCPECGAATGRFTPYIPFVDIPFYASIFGIMWERLFDRSTRWWTRAFFLLLIVWEGWPVLLAVPLEGVRRLVRANRASSQGRGQG